MLGVVLCAVAAWKSRRILCFAALVGGMLIGLYRGGVDQTHLAAYESYIGQAVMLSGVIDEDPSVAGSGTHALQLVQIQVDGRERIGTVYVTVETDEMTMRRSDRVTMRGQLIAGFGNFAASMYRAEVVSATRPVPGDVALEARDSFAAKVRGGVDEPAASLGVGFLLGQKSALPSTLVDALQVAGLTHIVVASGYNLMVLVRLSRRALEKHSRYLATLASAGLIVGFIAMTGMTSSMTRAGLVAALGLAAWYVGRRFHPVTLLVFAAAVTVLAQPSNVWGNVGWMLSFAAFAGVMIVAPLFTAYFFGKEKVPFVPQLFIETSSAQLATLPIIVATFGNVSVVALLANLLILPLIPFTMLLTFLTGVVGFIAPVLQPLVAWPTQLVLDVIVHIVEWCASLPGAQIEWQASVWVAAGMYVILILGCAYVKWRTGYRLGSASVVD
jgi:competence protein ComEC